jgi:hypothetical protein
VRLSNMDEVSRPHDLDPYLLTHHACKGLHQELTRLRRSARQCPYLVRLVGSLLTYEEKLPFPPQQRSYDQNVGPHKKYSSFDENATFEE